MIEHNRSARWPATPRPRAAFLAGAACGGLMGLMMGALLGDILAQAALELWRWFQVVVLRREDEVDFELLLQ